MSTIYKIEWSGKHREVKPVMRWLKERVADFDLHRLEHVRLVRGARALYIMYGAKTVAVTSDEISYLKVDSRRPFGITAYYWRHPVTIESPRPSLYRRDGHWAPAPSNQTMAVTWPDQVLDAFSAVCMTRKGNLIEQFMFDYTRNGNRFDPISKRPAIDNGETEILPCYSMIELWTAGEQIAYGFSRAFYLFARRTKQLPGRLHEVHAAAHARAELAAWRTHVAEAARENAPKTPEPVEGFPGINGTEGRIVGFPGVNGTWRR